jgi:hypothetical protein
MAAEGGHTMDDGGWMAFPGGELEGRRPKALCRACREHLAREASRAVGDSNRRKTPGSKRALCFHCYRTELDRQRALTAAGQLDTASVERFQAVLPFEPVNLPRLAMLKAERSTARADRPQGVTQFVDKRRQAQIAARHALQRIVAGIKATGGAAPHRAAVGDEPGRDLGGKHAPGKAERAFAVAMHAAELQLPESWMPFVVSR